MAFTGQKKKDYMHVYAPPYMRKYRARKKLEKQAAAKSRVIDAKTQNPRNYAKNAGVNNAVDAPQSPNGNRLGLNSPELQVVKC